MRCAVYCATIIAVSWVVTAQEQKPATETKPTFEVASIKRNQSGTTGGGFGEQPNGRWSMVNTAVVSLIRAAYPGRAGELAGAPGWVLTEQYDVNATAGGSPTREQMQLMLQALLADRFKLAVHDETRELPVFALVVARDDRRLAAACGRWASIATPSPLRAAPGGRPRAPSLATVRRRAGGRATARRSG
jgi:uncharacterized protein (TIGR03435 family)